MLEDDDRVQIVTLFTRVLLQLAQHPRISQETLARRLDVTMRTAQRHLSLLEEQGYIQVNRGQKPFRYTVDWSKSCPHLPWMYLVWFHPALKDAVFQWGDAILKAGKLDEVGQEHFDEAIRQVMGNTRLQGVRAS